MKWHRAPGRLPPGERVYAIGDVHGEAARLSALHAAIAADLAAHPSARATLVHLGDTIDRGPDSAGALDALLAFEACPSVNLMGNHEQTLLAALDGDAPAATDWLHYGGREALASWGVAPHTPRARWAELIPDRHQFLMRGLALWHRAGPYLFVHAGVKPGVALDRQNPDDLLRIRGLFLDSEADFGAIVVHGHTPVRERVADIRANRINLDTGAVYGGPLTCGVFEEDRVGFLTA